MHLYEVSSISSFKIFFADAGPKYSSFFGFRSSASIKFPRKKAASQIHTCCFLGTLWTNSSLSHSALRSRVPISTSRTIHSTHSISSLTDLVPWLSSLSIPSSEGFTYRLSFFIYLNIWIIGKSRSLTIWSIQYVKVRYIAFLYNLLILPTLFRQLSDFRSRILI